MNKNNTPSINLLYIQKKYENKQIIGCLHKLKKFVGYYFYKVYHKNNMKKNVYEEDLIFLNEKKRLNAPLGARVGDIFYNPPGEENNIILLKMSGILFEYNYEKESKILQIKTCHKYKKKSDFFIQIDCNNNVQRYLELKNATNNKVYNIFNFIKLALYFFNIHTNIFLYPRNDIILDDYLYTKFYIPNVKYNFFENKHFIKDSINIFLTNLYKKYCYLYYHKYAEYYKEYSLVYYFYVPYSFQNHINLIFDNKIKIINNDNNILLEDYGKLYYENIKKINIRKRKDQLTEYIDLDSSVKLDDLFNFIDNGIKYLLDIYNIDKLKKIFLINNIDKWLLFWKKKYNIWINIYNLLKKKNRKLCYDDIFDINITKKGFMNCKNYIILELYYVLVFYYLESGVCVKDIYLAKNIQKFNRIMNNLQWCYYCSGFEPHIVKDKSYIDYEIDELDKFYRGNF